jgi:hypothetical protein
MPVRRFMRNVFLGIKLFRRAATIPGFPQSEAISAARTSALRSSCGSAEPDFLGPAADFAEFPEFQGRADEPPPGSPPAPSRPPSVDPRTTTASAWRRQVSVDGAPSGQHSYDRVDCRPLGAGRRCVPGPAPPRAIAPIPRTLGPSAPARIPRPRRKCRMNPSRAKLSRQPRPRKGSQETLEELQRRNFMTLGTSRVRQEREELLVTELGTDKKIKLAFLNYTKGLTNDRFLSLAYILRGRNANYALIKENERFAKEMFRNIARLFFPSALIVDSEAFVKHVAQEIRKARADGVDYVVVFLHWGDWEQTLPTAGQRQLALELCRSGADAIIGAGPHVIQPFELIDAEGNAVSGDHEAGRHECFVAYSLGNFISAHSGLKSYGMALEMTIAEDATGFYLQNVRPHIVKSETHSEDTTGMTGNRPDHRTIKLRLMDMDEFLGHLP